MVTNRKLVGILVNLLDGIYIKYSGMNLSPSIRPYTTSRHLLKEPWLYAKITKSELHPHPIQPPLSGNYPVLLAKDILPQRVKPL